MRPFTLGKKTWEKATVARRHDDRSYEVETPTMNYRRNRVDLRRTEELPATEFATKIPLGQDMESNNSDLKNKFAGNPKGDGNLAVCRQANTTRN